MHKMNYWWQSVANHFTLLIFVEAVFLVSEMMRMAGTFKFMAVPLLDAAATYALLSALGAMVAVILAVLMSGMKVLSVHTGMKSMSTFVDGMIFALITMVCLNLFRLGMAAYGLVLLRVPAVIQCLGFAVVGLIIFWYLNSSHTDWLMALTKRIGFAIWTWISLTFVLTIYLFAEPLYRFHSPDVALANNQRKLPNVIIIVLDSLTSRDMSLYGYKLCTTPNMDALGREWTNYINAHSAGTSTIAFMPTLVTGRYPYYDEWHRYGDTIHGESNKWVSVPAILKTIGYHVALIGGGIYNPNLFHLHHDFDQVKIGGMRFPGRSLLAKTVWAPVGPGTLVKEYLIPNWPSHSIMGSQSPGSDPEYLDAEKYFVERADKSKAAPFFVYCHMNRPHYPYTAGEFEGSIVPLNAGMAEDRDQLPYINQRYLPEQKAEIALLRLRYDENIRKADAEVGKLVRLLQKLDLYDQSLIIITADHGANFVRGFQGYHTPLLTAAEHSIPMMVKYPGQKSGQRIEGLVSHVDLAPTILDVIGVTYSDSWFDGRPLSIVLKDASRSIFVRRTNEPATNISDVFAVLTGNYKLISSEGRLSLYDISVDQDEGNNIIGKIKVDALVRDLKHYEIRLNCMRTGNALATCE